MVAPALLVLMFRFLIRSIVSLSNEVIVEVVADSSTPVKTSTQYSNPTHAASARLMDVMKITG